MSAGTSGGSSNGAGSRATLSYTGIPCQMREILEKRPLLPHKAELLRVSKKYQLETFLRQNNIQCKSNDRKNELADRIIDYVTRHAPKPVTLRARTPIPGVPEDLLLSLSVDSVTMLRNLERGSLHDLESLLMDFGGVLAQGDSKKDLLKKMAELLEEQNRVEKGLEVRQGQNTQKSKAKRLSSLKPECCVCLEDYVQTALIPCGHAAVCKSCGSKLTECPMCRSAFTGILNIYF